MRAWVLESPGKPLCMKEVPDPVPEAGQVLVKVDACGVCRTDLHILDGELPDLGRPVIPGHQVVGRIIRLGAGVDDLSVGVRVGLPWLGWTCGHCEYCASGRENLCDEAKFHGYHLNGGYAELVVADARYAFPIPEGFSDLQAAPLLCAGLIGYRAYRMAGEGKRLGFYGFGSAAHILIQLALFEGKEVYAFTREGDVEGQSFARQLGAVWAGSSEEKPPVLLDAAILFAPVGSLVPRSLEHIKKGGRVVSAGIYMSDIPSFPYKILWEERSVYSVANLTRQDGIEFLRLAPRIPIRTEVIPYPFEEANQALDDLRHGRFNGSAVLVL